MAGENLDARPPVRFRHPFGDAELRRGCPARPGKGPCGFPPPDPADPEFSQLALASLSGARDNLRNSRCASALQLAERNRHAEHVVAGRMGRDEATGPPAHDASAFRTGKTHQPIPCAIPLATCPDCFPNCATSAEASRAEDGLGRHSRAQRSGKYRRRGPPDAPPGRTYRDHFHRRKFDRPHLVRNRADENAISRSRYQDDAPDRQRQGQRGPRSFCGRRAGRS